METILGLDYPSVWFIIIAVLFIGYAILDGYDFGAGSWHLFFKDNTERRIAINAVGPLWDGNEVWLVIGGGALFAGFPLMYATLFSGMYVPFMLFLLFLIFRAISIEFRSKEPMIWWTKTWDISYSVSSGMLALLLGVVLGNVLQGMQVGDNFDYAGAGFFEFLTPYPLVIGLLSLTLMMWHGALYLMYKTEGAMQQQIISLGKKGFILFVVLYIAATLFTVYATPQNLSVFHSNPAFWLFPLHVPVAIALSYIFYTKTKYVYGFICSSLTIGLLLIVAAMGVFPNLLVSTIDPAHTITIYNAASSEKTLGIMLLIVSIGTPLLIAYTVIALYIFRGKVKLDETSY
ncbi:MAG TPA: cytochrome d ubiquinol oxidase subunit II [Bacteroidales bacterium]|nr:cytochrome d ubiquinol oxidase subunit II [Bacteroidales bacterium]